MSIEDDKLDFIDLWFDEPLPPWSRGVNRHDYIGLVESPVLDSTATRIQANVVEMYKGTHHGIVLLDVIPSRSPDYRRRMCKCPRALFFADTRVAPGRAPCVSIPNGWFPVEDGACGPIVSIDMRKGFFLDLKNVTEAEGLLKAPLQDFQDYCGLVPQWGGLFWWIEPSGRQRHPGSEE